jgi:hypothetical protein
MESEATQLQRLCLQVREHRREHRLGGRRRHSLPGRCGTSEVEHAMPLPGPSLLAVQPVRVSRGHLQLIPNVCAWLVFAITLMTWANRVRGGSARPALPNTPRRHQQATKRTRSEHYAERSVKPSAQAYRPTLLTGCVRIRLTHAARAPRGPSPGAGAAAGALVDAFLPAACRPVVDTRNVAAGQGACSRVSSARW